MDVQALVGDRVIVSDPEISASLCKLGVPKQFWGAGEGADLVRREQVDARRQFSAFGVRAKIVLVPKEDGLVV